MSIQTLEDLENLLDSGIGFLADFLNTGYDIGSFSSYFKGGARSYLFLWKPNTTFLKDDYKYLLKAASVPETTTEEIIVEYQQLNYKMGGKKIFNDWSVSLLTDSKAEIRHKFESWSNIIHQIKKVGSNFTYKHHFSSDYMAEESFMMLDNKFDNILKVRLHGLWPKIIGPISMDYASMDFAQFDVTFSYLYHEITKDVSINN